VVVVVVVVVVVDVCGVDVDVEVVDVVVVFNVVGVEAVVEKLVISVIELELLDLEVVVVLAAATEPVGFNIVVKVLELGDEIVSVEARPEVAVVISCKEEASSCALL
jgi:hypothetical protein